MPKKSKETRDLGLFKRKRLKEDKYQKFINMHLQGMTIIMACRILGIGRTTAYRILHKAGIETPRGQRYSKPKKKDKVTED